MHHGVVRAQREVAMIEPRSSPQHNTRKAAFAVHADQIMPDQSGHRSRHAPTLKIVVPGLGPSANLIAMGCLEAGRDATEEDRQTPPM